MANVSPYTNPGFAPATPSRGVSPALPDAPPLGPSVSKSEDKFTSSQICLIEDLEKRLKSMSPEAMTRYVIPYLPQGSPEENQKLEKQVLEHYQAQAKFARREEIRRECGAAEGQWTKLPKDPHASEAARLIPTSSEAQKEELECLNKELENYVLPDKFIGSLPPKTQEAFRQAELDLAGSLIAQLDHLGEPYTLGNKVKPSTAQLDEALGETKTEKRSFRATLKSKIMVKAKAKLKAMFRTVCKWLAKQLNKV
jgi:hypothetical protein